MTASMASVSLHYFRVPRSQWELMLTRLRQLGAETIVTPVPWGFHHFATERLDLSGVTNPRRDVAGFVRLCAAMGFSIRLELSPVVPQQGLLLDGLPGWLLKKHPDIRQITADGTPASLPVWEHPTLLKALGQWWQSLSTTLLPLPETSSAQLIDLPATEDFSAHTTAVQWTIWLRKKYAEGGVAALNAAYTPSTPFNTINQIKLNTPLDSPAFAADKAEFQQYVMAHARETYTALLLELGWKLSDPLAPPHRVQIPANPADAGTDFRWAMDAPIRADGSPTPEFWRQKEANTLTKLSAPADAHQIMVSSPTETVQFEIAGAVVPFRLRLDGALEPVAMEKKGEKTAFLAIPAGEDGQTDIYFTLPAAGTPVSGTLAVYLRSLLTGQQHALAHVAQSVAQLDAALTPDPAGSPTAAAPSPELSEAHAALTDANAALQRAAASIGALEDVFASALNAAPTQSAALSFMVLEKEKLARVKSACENARFTINNMPDPTLPETFTVEDYRQRYEQIGTAANAITVRFENALQWLREQLVLGNLSSSAWSVHAKLETILKLLYHGVLRK